MYYKQLENGYINAIGKNCGGIEITKQDYDTILDVIRHKPAETDTMDYRLREDLTWEYYEKDPPDPDPEVDDSELVEILLGGES